MLLDHNPIKRCWQKAVRLGGLIVVILGIGCLNPPVTSGADSEYVKAFKAFLEKPPTSGRAMIRFRSGNTAAQVYEAVWFGEDFYFAMTAGNSENGRVPMLSFTNGSWTGKRWECAENNLTLFEVIPETMRDMFNDLGAIGMESVLREFFALGIQRLAPGSILWSGNSFSAHLRNKMKIAGLIKVNDLGQVNELEYQLIGTQARFRITYEYSTELAGKIPATIHRWSSHDGAPFNDTSCLEMVALKDQLEKSEWARYSPDKLFPNARVFLETKGGRFEKHGDNLIPLKPRPHQRSDPWLKRVVVLAVIAGGSIALLITIRKLRVSQ